jgi:hypothetical protein
MLGTLSVLAEPHRERSGPRGHRRRPHHSPAAGKAAYSNVPFGPAQQPDPTGQDHR